VGVALAVVCQRAVHYTHEELNVFMAPCGGYEKKKCVERLLRVGGGGGGGGGVLFFPKPKKGQGKKKKTKFWEK